MEDKMSMKEAGKSVIEAADLEVTVNDLKRRLTESEAVNENLKTYIDHLKKSYHSVFGGNNNSNSSPSSLSVNP
jgi:hypothetical protein